MNQFYPKNLRGRWLLLCGLSIITVLIIHSCKKESRTVDPNQAVADAQNWYESTYPVLSSSLGSRQLSLSRTPGGSANTAGTDFSQLTKPDWQHNAVYKRFDKDVIEMPFDPSSISRFALKANVKTFNKDYTRTSFLILKDNNNTYNAYVMMIVADSSYVNNDPAKLANNTFRKHDADFSGMVLYFTPKGKFLSSWAYKSGVLQPPTNVPESDKPTTGSQLSKGRVLAQSQNTKITGAKALATESPFTLVCVDYDVVTYTSNPDDAVTVQYAFTICYWNSIGSGEAPSAPDPSDNSTGNTGSTTPLCPPGTGMSVHPAGRVLANTAPITPPPDPNDPGFPDPTPPATTSCYIPNPTTTKNILDQLMKNTNSLTDDQNAAILTVVNQIANNCIGAAEINYLVTNNIQFDWSVNSTISAQAKYVTDGAVPPSGAIMIKDITTLSSPTLSEELFHSYQDNTYAGGITQNASNNHGNIEFEAKVLRDMTNVVTQTGGITGFAPGYTDFILDITNNGLSFPSAFTADQLVQYKTYLANFVDPAYSTGYENQPIDNQMLPNAMFGIINSSLCRIQQ